jgi:hypothetical protein
VRCYSISPPYLETAKVFDMLLAVPKVGSVKATKILHSCRVSPSKTFGGLSERQRAETRRAPGPVLTYMFSDGRKPAGGFSGHRPPYLRRVRRDRNLRIYRQKVHRGLLSSAGL